MDALQPLLDLIRDTVRLVLETELPAQLRRYTLPNDPDKLYSYAEAAEYMGVTESAVKERVKLGELWTVELGKFRKIPQRAISEYIARARKRHEDHGHRVVLPEGIDPEIEMMLTGASGGTERRKSRRRTKGG